MLRPNYFYIMHRTETLYYDDLNQNEANNRKKTITYIYYTIKML